MSDAGPDLSGRCGSCGWYRKVRTNDAGVAEGECRLGQGSWPLVATATCSMHKPIGASFKKSLEVERVAGAPRRRGGVRGGGKSGPEPEVRKHIPQELDLDMDQDEFRQVLREVLLDELGIRDVPLGERWRGGEVVFKPGRDGTQEKSIPIDVFFKKIVMVRDKLRVLEQKVNANKHLADDEKVALQQYITGCYGSLTTFNVLFADKTDHFRGQKSGD